MFDALLPQESTQKTFTYRIRQFIEPPNSAVFNFWLRQEWYIGLLQGYILGQLWLLLNMNCQIVFYSQKWVCNLMIQTIHMQPNDRHYLFQARSYYLKNLKAIVKLMSIVCMFTGTRCNISLISSQRAISLDGHFIEWYQHTNALVLNFNETLSWDSILLKSLVKLQKYLQHLEDFWYLYTCRTGSRCLANKSQTLPISPTVLKVRLERRNWWIS